MKKIILFTLLLLFSCQICLAKDPDYKLCQKDRPTLLTETPLKANNLNLDSEPKAKQVIESPNAINPLTVSNNNQTTEETNNIFTNDPQTITELKGYLEYDDIAEETIYLDQPSESIQNTVFLTAPADSNKLKIKNPTKVSSKSLIHSSTKQIPMSNLKRLDSAAKFSSQEYNFSPTSSSYSVKSGNISIGTTYNSGMDSAQSTYSTGVFTKYEGKHHSFTTAFSKSTNNSYDSYSDKIFFAPELKLTKRLSIVDIIQTDMLQVNRRNEVVLRYTPHLIKYADDVQLEVGAGQSFYQNSFNNASIRFSTRFKL